LYKYIFVKLYLFFTRKRHYSSINS